MADNKISMPSGMAGLTRFNEESPSMFVLTPMTIFIIIGVFAVFLLIMLMNNGSLGHSLLGLA